MVRLLPEFNLQDEAAMRAFYEQCGISRSTIEAAVEMRRKNSEKPVDAADPIDPHRRAKSMNDGPISRRR
jgi:hypothetical protein